MRAIKRKTMVMMAAGALALAMGAGAATITRAGQRSNAGAATAAEPHPAIEAALVGLREAKRALENAQHDFDGHRAAALKDVDAAILECQAALKVDPK